MKKLLIIGASILQLPAVTKAKQLGYFVGVIDYNPEAVCVKLADEYFNVSTIDINGVVKVAEKFRPDGIITLATDMPMRAIAAACKKLRLPGISPETAIKATDKGEMIKAFEAHCVEHPQYHIAITKSELGEISNKVGYPCIIKPTDSSGSRGVVLVKNLYELERAYTYSVEQSLGGGVIIEEYMCGHEVSVEVIVTDGEPYLIAITDKLTTGSPHFVEMGHSQPSMLDSADLIRIGDLAYRAVKSVGIKYGSAHVEIILTPSGPKMVELGARLGGDCITTHLVPLSTGVDMVEAIIKIACGEKPDITPKLNKGSAIRYFDVPCGVIMGITGEDEACALDGVREISFVKNVGDLVGAIVSSTDRVGFVIAQGKDASEAIDICEKAMNKIGFVIKEQAV
ncbi:MAG: ATP-grasp domain-containing protein [Saccharofermentanales bacterium]